jgi:hypothetical protein
MGAMERSIGCHIHRLPEFGSSMVERSGILRSRVVPTGPGRTLDRDTVGPIDEVGSGVTGSSPARAHSRSW